MTDEFGRPERGWPELQWRVWCGTERSGESAQSGEWSFSERLRFVRGYYALTQRVIAAHLSVDRSTYAYYETGKSLPSIPIFRELCVFLRVSPEFLLGWERDQNP